MKKLRNDSYNETARKRGVVYVRVSDAEQIAGTSLDDQERQCIEKLTADRVEVVEKFRDEGVSAKTADREQLMAAVAFCLERRNRVNVFMVWKVDRFARRTEDHFAIRKLLTDGGVELRSVTEPIGDDPTGKLFEVMLAGFAEFDNAIRALRATNGMRARIRDGVWPFRSPVGYLNRRLCSQAKKKTDPDPIDPIIFPLLQELLKGFARGAYTQSEMVQKLQAAGLREITGTKPTIQFVDGLLRKQLPFYAGLLRDSFGEQVVYRAGRHVPMITADEMRAIELRRDGGKGVHVAHPKTNSLFPLRGILLCKGCGKSVTGSSPRGRSGRYPYYHCYRVGCSMRNRGLPKVSVEQAFEALLARLTPAPAFVEALTRSLESQFDLETKCSLEKTESIREAICALEARRARVLDLAEGGAYDVSQAHARLHEIDRQIASERIALGDAESNEVASNAGSVEAVHCMLQIMNGTIDLPDEARVRFQRIIFPRGISYDREQGFGTVKIARILEINQRFRHRNSALVGRDRAGWNQVRLELRQVGKLIADSGAPSRAVSERATPTSIAWCIGPGRAPE